MRNQRRAKFISENSFCCYCGGNTKTVEIDHVPSRQLFVNRDAPYAMRVPACSDCNRTTSESEQVAAFLARIGFGRTMCPDDARLIEGLANASPDVAMEMMPRRNQLRRVRQLDSEARAFNVSGPLVNRQMQIYGAKLALAMHYTENDRIPLKKAGGVWVRWWTNVNLLEGPILPTSLESRLTAPIPLRQGRKTSKNQFEYSKLFTADKSVTCFFATFSFSFAMLFFIANEKSFFEDLIAEGEWIHQPGKNTSYPMPLSSGRLRLTI